MGVAAADRVESGGELGLVAVLNVDEGAQEQGHAVAEAPHGGAQAHQVGADRLVEAHMYERETDRHYPPQDMAVLGPIIDRLLAAPLCTWWTIELNDCDEALATRALLLDYLRTKQR